MIKKAAFILMFIVFGCKNDSKIISTDFLIGDWKGEFSINKVSGIKNYKRNLTFINDSIGSNFYSGRFAKYKIEDSTLTFYHPIYKYKEYHRGGDRFTYKLKYFSEDSLIVTPISFNAKKYYNEYEDLIFKKIKRKNNHTYKKIGFYCSGCYGSCPSLYVEIDNDGTILFNGIRHTDVKKYQSGILDSEILKLITEKINLIDWPKIENEYSARYTDAATCGIRIQFNNNQTVNCMIYGSDREPIELANLFHLIKESYKFSNIKPDSLVKNQFEFNDLAVRVLPPPPPPSNSKALEEKK